MLLLYIIAPEGQCRGGEDDAVDVQAGLNRSWRIDIKYLEMLLQITNDILFLFIYYIFFYYNYYIDLIVIT